MPDYKYKTVRTVKKIISHTGVATSTSTKLDSESTTVKRMVQKRVFAGGVIYNSSSSSQALTAIIKITNGTNNYYLDRTLIGKGDSAVWSEHEYGIELDSDEYVEISVAESLASGDNLYIFLRFRDIY